MQTSVFTKKFRHVRGVQYIFVQQTFGIVYYIKYLSKCLLQLASIPNNLELYIYNNILSTFYGG